MEWSRIRAALLAFVLATQAASALPTPNLDDGLVRDPAAQAELARWTATLASLGIDLTNEQLATLATHGSEVLRSTRRTLLAPMRPVLRLIGTDQDWALFAFPATHPFQIEVAARTGDGPWTVLYRPNDPDATFLAETIEYRRFRGVMVPLRGRPPSWAGGVDFLAREVFLAHPQVTEVRVQAIRTATVLPGQGPGTVDVRYTETRRR